MITGTEGSFGSLKVLVRKKMETFLSNMSGFILSLESPESSGTKRDKNVEATPLCIRPVGVLPRTTATVAVTMPGLCSGLDEME